MLEALKFNAVYNTDTINWGNPFEFEIDANTNRNSLSLHFNGELIYTDIYTNLNLLVEVTGKNDGEKKTTLLEVPIPNDPSFMFVLNGLTDNKQPLNIKIYGDINRLDTHNLASSVYNIETLNSIISWGGFMVGRYNKLPFHSTKNISLPLEIPKFGDTPNQLFVDFQPQFRDVIQTWINSENIANLSGNLRSSFMTTLALSNNVNTHLNWTNNNINWGNVTNLYSAFKFRKDINTFNIFRSHKLKLSGDNYGIFMECTNLNFSCTPTNFSFIDVQNLEAMFLNCTALNSPISFDFTTNTSTFSCQNFIQNCTSFNSNITILGGNKVVNYSSFFAGCVVFNKPVNFDLSGALTATSMFAECEKFNQNIDFNMIKCTDTSTMFRNCRELNPTIFDFKNTNSIVNTSQMFQNCYVFDTPIPSFKSTINIFQMFSGCLVFNQKVDLYGANVTSFNNVFSNCNMFDNEFYFRPYSASNMRMFDTNKNIGSTTIEDLNPIHLDLFVKRLAEDTTYQNPTGKLTDRLYITAKGKNEFYDKLVDLNKNPFLYAPYLQIPATIFIDSTNNNTFTNLFDIGANNNYIYTKFMVSGDLDNTFSGYVSKDNKSVTVPNISTGKTIKYWGKYYEFNDVNNTNQNYTKSSTINTGQVIRKNSKFTNAPRLKSIDFTSFVNTLNTQYVQSDYSQAFNGNINLVELKSVGNYLNDTVLGHNINTYMMFNECKKLTFEFLNILNTSYLFANTTNSALMFGDCNEFNHLFTGNNALNLWSKVTNISQMFIRCSKFNQALNFSTTNVINTASEVLRDCVLFNQIVTIKARNMTGFFSGCIAYDRPFTVPTEATNMSLLFSGCVNLATSAIMTSGTNTTPNLTSTSNMFRGCLKFNGIVKFTTENVTNVSDMFNGCVVMTGANIDSTVLNNLTKCTNFTSMFESCRLLNTTKISSIGVSDKAINLSFMFNNCEKLNVNSFNYNTINVTNFDSMFGNNNLLNTSITFNTISGTNFSSMFSGCSLFNQPIGFVTTNAVQLSGMFRGCLKFNQSIDFDLKNATNLDKMFMGCAEFNPTIFNLKNTLKVTDMSDMLNGCVVFNASIFLNTSNLLTNLKGFLYMTNGGIFDKDISISNTLNVTDFSYFLTNCYYFNKPIGIKTNSAKTLEYMFSGCGLFNQNIDFDTSKVNEFGYMFNSCGGFNKPINFDCVSALNMTNMFNKCNSFNSSISLNNTGKCTNFEGIFKACDAFNKPLSIDTENATNMRDFLSQCPNYSSNIFFINSTNKVMDFTNSFTNCAISTLPQMNFTSCKFMYNMILDSSNISIASYDNFLKELSLNYSNVTSTDRTINVTNLKYSSAGAVFRNTLVNNGFTINGDSPQ